MELTANLGLKKPSVDDFVDVEDWNFNADKIDAEIEKKLDKSGGTLTGDLTLGAKEDGITHRIAFNDIASIETVHDSSEKALLLNSQNTLLFKPGDRSSVTTVNRLAVLDHVYFRNELFQKKADVLKQNKWERYLDGTHSLRYKLIVEELESRHVLDITIDKNSMAIAEKAQICPTVEEKKGYAYIYAKNEPTGDILITRKVVL